MIPNSFICKLINVQAREKENNEKQMKNYNSKSKVLEEEIIMLMIPNAGIIKM